MQYYVWTTTMASDSAALHVILFVRQIYNI